MDTKKVSKNNPAEKTLKKGASSKRTSKRKPYAAVIIPAKSSNRE